ncbi:MAG TPA: asparagine synthase (glutamine-hydrolyzing) [Gemmatimonadaceae bacterium]|nr:asparagine synthase (glutamine-hydrolyzing) [Gemmatimonadaceae bacterium]
MCGICGIAFSSESGRRVERAALERMTDVLLHRGPDDCGVFLDANVGLGHRRLSIVDVAGGHQPMLSDDEHLSIVYNGEVYNHPVLRAQLEAMGYRYRTRCDTETVLHLYAAHGFDSPRHLRGMFAFAIWDRRRRELFLVRDRFGVKPLYYVLTPDGSLYFASEIKALLAARAVTPRLNVGALPDYLANHAPSGEETLFEGVRRLPAGCTLRWRDGTITIEQYWDLRGAFDSCAPAAPDREIIDEFASRFKEAVRLRLMADVPLGVFLSGGIDSAAITATMSELVDAPVKTFSVALAEREANELRYARMVAERFRTDHHEVVVSPKEFFDVLGQLVWQEDEPIAHPSSIALYFVSRLAAEHVKVVLTGEGSDEMLAGYGRYRTTIYNLALGRLYERLAPRPIRRAVQASIGGLAKKFETGRKFKRTALYLPADVTSLYFDNFAVFSRDWQETMFRPGLRERIAADRWNPYAIHHELFNSVGRASLLTRLLYVDVKTYLHELLMKQDQMSMAASIESRVPFLDHPLAEFAASMPDRLKLHGWTTKYVLRQAMRGTLPPTILKRRKMGFPVPIGRWLCGPYRWLIDEYVLGERAIARDLFEPEAVRRLVAAHLSGENHSEHLWSLINLEMWQRIFLDGEDARHVGEGARVPTQRRAVGKQRLAQVEIS